MSSSASPSVSQSSQRTIFSLTRLVVPKLQLLRDRNFPVGDRRERFGKSVGLAEERATRKFDVFD